MHEYGLAEQVLNKALEEARKAGTHRIKELRFLISANSHINEESMRMYLESLSQGTMAEGAVLSFRIEPDRAHCLDCDEIFLSAIQGSLVDCPHCGGQGLFMPTEREFGLESMEIE
jgi:hydrogenase nickel incorporation protein HypA/HybF